MMILPSVIYREGELTERDYDEAIESLTMAKQSLKDGHDRRGCLICTDTGHFADACHHNVLLMARRLIKKECEWRCFHCGTEFTDHDEAEKHFGVTRFEKAECCK